MNNKDNSGPRNIKKRWLIYAGGLLAAAIAGGAIGNQLEPAPEPPPPTTTTVAAPTTTVASAMTRTEELQLLVATMIQSRRSNELSEEDFFEKLSEVAVEVAGEEAVGDLTVF